jgi:hypothetical protein
MSRALKSCTMCGCELVWKHPETDMYMESSANLPDWPICHGCMVDHCVQTNCLGCGYGEYPACQFLSTKRHYMSKD